MLRRQSQLLKTPSRWITGPVISNHQSWSESPLRQGHCHRLFIQPSRTNSASSKIPPISQTPKFSEGVNADDAAPRLNELLSKSSGRWTLTEDGQGVWRTYQFKSFKTTWVRSFHFILPFFFFFFCGLPLNQQL